ncbi:MAG: YceD family protein [bacterium]
MKIDLTELLQKIGRETAFEEFEKVCFPEDDLSLTKPVEVRLQLFNTGSSILIRGEVKSETELECSRCLTKFKRPLTVKIEEEFAKDAPADKGSKSVELRPEDFVHQIEPDNTIDLTEVIRQNLLLAVPIKTLCKQDCEGIKSAATKKKTL